jgi:hypothetical protein
MLKIAAAGATALCAGILCTTPYSLSVTPHDGNGEYGDASVLRFLKGLMPDIHRGSLPRLIRAAGVWCVPGNPERSAALKLSGQPNGRSTMAENRIALIGLSVIGVTATITIALAQNTSNPMTSGNTTNPILSGNTVAQPRETPVSPSTPSLNLSTGTNPFTGQPCSGPPTTGSPTATFAFPSVYGPPATSC